MTPAATWHPAEQVLQDYVHAVLPGPSAGSVEAHLLACAACRLAIQNAVPAERLSRLRDGLEDRVDAAERSRLERVLVRCGLHESDARALLAAPSLRRAWWLAVVAAAILGAIVARDTNRPDALFLVFAPLLPLVTTALAYSPALDPAFELVAATPYRTMRLLLARSLAVGVTSIVGVACAALALPDRDLTAAVWLLPTLALTLLVLTLSRRFGVGAAASGVTAGWMTLVATFERQGFDVEWLRAAATQGTSAVLAVIALVVLARQWTRLDGGGWA